MEGDHGATRSKLGMGAKEQPMKLTVGRIVHYVNDSGHIRPAIVTCVWSDDCVNLNVFSDGSYDMPGITGQTTICKTSVTRNDPKIADSGSAEFATQTWHWPEYGECVIDLMHLMADKRRSADVR